MQDVVQVTRAGTAYFGIVFAAGFVLGTVRTLLLVPRLGELLAVLVELPLILWISWIACGWVVARLSFPKKIGHRLAMGGVAFGLLMAAEVALSTLLFGRSIDEFIAGRATIHGVLGLAGQALFASMPAIRA